MEKRTCVNIDIQRTNGNMADGCSIAGYCSQHNCVAVGDLSAGDGVVLVVLHDAAQLGECTSCAGAVLTGDYGDCAGCTAAASGETACHYAQCSDCCCDLCHLFHNRYSISGHHGVPVLGSYINPIVPLEKGDARQGRGIIPPALRATSAQGTPYGRLFKGGFLLCPP